MNKKKLKAKLAKSRSKVSRLVEDLAEAEKLIEGLSLKKVEQPAEANGRGKAEVKVTQANRQRSVNSKPASKKA